MGPVLAVFLIPELIGVFGFEASFDVIMGMGFASTMTLFGAEASTTVGMTWPAIVGGVCGSGHCKRDGDNDNYGHNSTYLSARHEAEAQTLYEHLTNREITTFTMPRHKPSRIPLANSRVGRAIAAMADSSPWRSGNSKFALLHLPNTDMKVVVPRDGNGGYKFDHVARVVFAGGADTIDAGKAHINKHLDTWARHTTALLPGMITRIGPLMMVNGMDNVIEQQTHDNGGLQSFAKQWVERRLEGEAGARARVETFRVGVLDWEQQNSAWIPGAKRAINDSVAVPVTAAGHSRQPRSLLGEQMSQSAIDGDVLGHGQTASAALIGLIFFVAVVGAFMLGKVIRGRRQVKEGVSLP